MPSPMTSLLDIVNGRRSYCKSKIMDKVGNHAGLVRGGPEGCLKPGELHRQQASPEGLPQIPSRGGGSY
jgi:hypothetical protein